MSLEIMHKMWQGRLTPSLYLGFKKAIYEVKASGLQLRCKPHIGFRTPCVIMTLTRWSPTPTPCNMPHSQNFDKIDSFLKSFLNMCVLGNLIVGWGERVIKTGLVFCIKSIDLVEALIFGGVIFIKVTVGII